MKRELAPGFVHHRDDVGGGEYLEVPIRGDLLIDFPMFNKGTAFTEDERGALGLRGILPPRLVAMEDQVRRVMQSYAWNTTDLGRYIHLMALMDRNETLFYRVLLDHLEELLPIVYTPTVGQACQQFGRIFRRSRGIYLTPEDTPRIDALLSHWPFTDVAVIVVTDGERILGLGDLGAGGMGISIGKLSLYVTAAGIHPARTLPICLDVGTDNESLLNDPLYLGKPRRRVRGQDYDDLIDAFVAAVERRFPAALIQFEDFAKGNALRLLDRYRERACCFNDDIQGTGAVTLAGVLAGLRINGDRLEQQRVVIAGAGSAGIGIARALRGAQLWLVDSKGLLTASRSGLSRAQQEFARSEPDASFAEVVRRVRPTILVGTTGQAGFFTRESIQSMAGARPMVFPLSNPTANAECTPQQAREWTDGRALVAAGSPFPDTSQCNNVYVFPGVGLGVIASRASRVTDGMFAAAARALSAMARGERLFPPMSEIRSVSRAIALAVAREAIASGVAEPCEEAALALRIARETWEARYIPYRPSPAAVSRRETLQGSR